MEAITPRSARACAGGTSAGAPASPSSAHPYSRSTSATRPAQAWTVPSATAAGGRERTSSSGTRAAQPRSSPSPPRERMAG